jgi:hypothetical protein
MPNSDILQLQATLDSFRSLADKSVKLTFTTFEITDAEGLAEIIKNQNKIGHLLFAVRQIEAQDVADLPEPDTSDHPQGKTPSQRLRAVIYILWTQKGKKGNFEDFYMRTMSGVIEQFKDKLS